MSDDKRQVTDPLFGGTSPAKPDPNPQSKNREGESSVKASSEPVHKSTKRETDRITIYIEESVSEQLDLAMVKLKRIPELKESGVHRSIVCEYAIDMMLREFEIRESDSGLVNWLIHKLVD